MVTDSQPGHIDHIKQMNARIVYRLIDQHGPISRIDLSRLAHLAPASITKIVREMLDAHLVQETEIQESACRGRPATGLMIETETWHYLAISVRPGHIVLALCDLSGKRVAEDHRYLTSQPQPSFVARIIDHIDQFFIRHQQKLERLTAIAITLPGMIDSKKGTIHRMPFYAEVTHLPLGELLANHIGVPVYIQHDISAWTLAESLFGAAKGAQDVIQVVINHHVGASVIANGHLLQAGGHNLLEIGHIQVDPDGECCYCGNHGCLETIISIDRVLARAQAQMRQTQDSVLHQQPLSVEWLCQAALQGDKLARDIINGIGQHMGRILAIMVNLFHPQKILLGSPFNQAAEILFPAISACIRQQALPDYRNHIPVAATRLAHPGMTMGIALIKDALYNGSLLIRLLQG
ncbi:ROK family transcriptional regulator [Enterobacteriaceae bacterium ESL0689]|nr:ROK family transcriptional regulator [Enterobacteriaceae bacterium ESL0689]